MEGVAVVLCLEILRSMFISSYMNIVHVSVLPTASYTNVWEGYL